jgi:hypothetical protein
MAQARFSEAPDAERAQEAVTVERCRAKDLREAPGGDASVHFQLPQSVLRMHIAESELRIALGAREDVRHAVCIAKNFDGCSDAAHRRFTCH